MTENTTSTIDTDASNVEAPKNTNLNQESAPRDAWDLFVNFVILALNPISVLSGLILLASDSHNLIALALILFLIGPGSAVVQYLPTIGTAERWIIMIGLSMATSMLTAQLLMTLDLLRATPATLALTTITALGLPGVIKQLVSKELFTNQLTSQALAPQKTDTTRPKVAHD